MASPDPMASTRSRSARSLPEVASGRRILIVPDDHQGSHADGVLGQSHPLGDVVLGIQDEARRRPPVPRAIIAEVSALVSRDGTSSMQERVLPTEPGEASEVVVGGLQGRAMLDGERGQVRIRHQLAGHPDRLEQVAHER